MVQEAFHSQLLQIQLDRLGQSQQVWKDDWNPPLLLLGLYLGTDETPAPFRLQRARGIGRRVEFDLDPRRIGPVWKPQTGHEVLGARPNLEARNVDLDGLEVGNVGVRQVQVGEAADAPNPVRLQGMSVCESTSSK